MSVKKHNLERTAQGQVHMYCICEDYVQFTKGSFCLDITSLRLLQQSPCNTYAGIQNKSAMSIFRKYAHLFDQVKCFISHNTKCIWTTFIYIFQYQCIKTI